MIFSDLQRSYLVRLLDECAGEAYRDAGCRFTTFRDGSVGVHGASRKTIEAMNRIREHFAAAIGAANYVDKDRKPVSVPDIAR